MLERTRTATQETCSLKEKQRKKVIEHIHDTLTTVDHELMLEWKFCQVIVKNNGKHGGAPEGNGFIGTWFHAFIFVWGKGT